MTKQCPECGEPIKGRIDNNSVPTYAAMPTTINRTPTPPSYVRNVNNILEKNRRNF